MNKVESYIVKNYEQFLSSLGYSLYHVEFKKQHKEAVLRVYIELEDPNSIMDIDACEIASRALSDAFDSDNAFPIVDAYTFEVSSPGIERELYTTEHYKRYIDEKINIHLYKATDGKKDFTGILKSATDDAITVRLESKEVVLKYSDISKAQLYCDF